MKPPSGKDWIILSAMGFAGASIVYVVGVLLRAVRALVG